MKTLNKFLIGPKYPTKFIAEIGTCHEGSVGLCKEMIHAAKESGADFVKSQVIFPDKISWGTPKQLERYKYVKFSLGEWQKIFAYARTIDIPFFCSFFDVWGLTRYAGEMPCFKVAARSNQDLDLISMMARYNKPIFISAETTEVFDALNRFVEGSRFVKLYCVSKYPCDISDFNFINKFPPFDGVSDHSPTIEASVEAFRAGARVIEKHFTTVRNEAPDSKFALMPGEFKEMVSRIRSHEHDD